MSRRQLNIKVEEVEEVTVVSLDGSVDAANVHDFERTLKQVCQAKRPRVLLDFRHLSYVNSTSFGLLFKYRNACADRGGVFALCAVMDKILTIIKILGLDKFLDIYPSRKKGIEALQNA
jgi:anti-anti-sigma factor